MQSSLVKPSAIKGENGLERPPRSTQASAVPPVFTQSQGHLLPHNPAIMTSQVARHLSEGTGGELSGEAGWLVGLGWGVGGSPLLNGTSAEALQEVGGHQNV